MMSTYVRNQENSDRGREDWEEAQRENRSANKKVLGQVRQPGVLRDGEHSLWLDHALKGQGKGNTQRRG